MNPRNLTVSARKWWLLAVLALVLTGCKTLEYRTVQTDFEEAVRADNSGSPFGSELDRVFNTLTPAYIGKLRPELQPNAWMLRSVSAWRIGQFAAARTNSQAGLQLLGPTLAEGSRDHILLLMVEGLANDGELGKKWLANHRKVADGGYAEYRDGYESALTQLRLAEDNFNERTPPDVQAYCHYQQWRVTRNWEGVVGSLPGEQFNAASTNANQFLQRWLQTTNAITTMKQAQMEITKKLPDTHPLRALIRAQSGQ